jgi:copper chaperone NosL
MKTGRFIVMALLALALSACKDDRSAALPAPQEPGPDAVGTICRMDLAEHTGPKGQVFIKSQDKPLWFSSVRDTFTWLLIDEGTGRQFAAIYVNDMGKSSSWEKPDAGAWIEARKALFVTGSDRGSDMGGGELVPFSTRALAQEFAGKHGGAVVEYSEITSELLAQTGVAPPGPAATHASRGHHE